jgi:hypothetical protein
MDALKYAVQAIQKERKQMAGELAKLDAALTALQGRASVDGAGPRRVLSAAARKRIGDAQRKRWAKQKAGKPKRTMSASARRKIAAAQRARWAKTRGQQKKAA